MPTHERRSLPRWLDAGLAVLFLILCAPLLLWIALAVALTSPGPVFYRQGRVGQGGRLFQIWKFRTMSAAAAAGPCVTATDDARVTPLGRRLRSWKLDELPQLFNVVRGEMSLVGPRPQVPRFVDCFDPARRAVVLSVRPGITGSAALFFRHEEFMLAGKADRERFYVEQILPIKLGLDVHYVQTRTPWTDLHLLGDTLRLVWARCTGRAGASGLPTAWVPPNMSPESRPTDSSRSAASEAA